MKFRVFDRGEMFLYEKDTVYLQYDNWDDYCFKTSFNATYVDNLNKEHPIGPVKIGFSQMVSGRVYEHISKQFTSLPEYYFSLGQDEDYYDNIKKLGDVKREEILVALQDIAYNLDLFYKFENESVMRASLTRSITKFSIESQLHRMATGGVRLTTYHFSYSTLNAPSTDQQSVKEVSFLVKPNSNPPTNIHALIGRNGTGKTSLIKKMIYSIRSDDTSHGSFTYVGNSRTRAQFANVICVAFSPFDDFSELDTLNSSIPYSYIGLNKTSNDLLQTIEQQFFESFTSCMANARKRQLWLDSIETLKSDPTLNEVHINSLVNDTHLDVRDGTSTKDRETIKDVFSQLSSGHKVVLLIITSCVDKIEEKTIVFLDEPENHLHPPLLSALIRALSNLLIDRNGVSIVSTHSPVVLQEVPSSCVWTLRKYDGQMIAERLNIETFGSSISQLTNEVFGLEVTDSGFHKMLSDVVNSEKNSKLGDYAFERILDIFEGQLGDEAKLHLRMLLALLAKKEN